METEAFMSPMALACQPHSERALVLFNDVPGRVVTAPRDLDLDDSYNSPIPISALSPFVRLTLSEDLVRRCTDSEPRIWRRALARTRDFVLMDNHKRLGQASPVLWQSSERRSESYASSDSSISESTNTASDSGSESGWSASSEGKSVDSIEYDSSDSMTPSVRRYDMRIRLAAIARYSSITRMQNKDNSMFAISSSDCESEESESDDDDEEQGDNCDTNEGEQCQNCCVVEEPESDGCGEDEEPQVGECGDQETQVDNLCDQEPQVDNCGAYEEQQWPARCPSAASSIIDVGAELVPVLSADGTLDVGAFISQHTTLMRLENRARCLRRGCKRAMAKSRRF